MSKPKRDLTKLMGNTVLKIDDGKKPAPRKEQSASKKMIRFYQDDEMELDRIEDYLRERGIRIRDRTKLIRMALKVAFREVDSQTLQSFHEDIISYSLQGRPNT